MAAKNTTRRRKLFQIQEGKCYYCQREMTMELDKFHTCTIDHLVPQCNGGTNHMKNLVAACRNCNTVKSRGDAFFFKTLLEEREVEPFVSVKTILSKHEKRVLGEGVIILGHIKT